MLYAFENATPAEERKLRGWLCTLVEELGLEKADYKIHVRISDLTALVIMVPVPTPDHRLFLELNSHVPDKWLEGLSHEMIYIRQVIDNRSDRCP